MKIEVDCTPEEARTFLGLPDMEAVNKMVKDRMEEHMRKNLEKMTPEAFMKTWFPGGNPAVDAMQKFMTEAMKPQTGKGGDKGS